MSMQRKTIAITDQMDSWVKSQVDSGKYENDSEYFQDLLRRDQERREAETQLRFMLDEAESSGISERTPQEIWKEAETRFAEKNG
ncbi:MAG: type II toxin-antitoxin system ParD family antitoxin [Methylobacter sp.]